MFHPKGLGRVALAFFIAPLFLICTVASAQCNYRHGVIWYSTAPTEEIRDIAVDRYEVGITGLSSGPDRKAIKDLKPEFRWFVYNSLSDNYVPPHNGVIVEHEFLSELATQNGLDPEEVYLHYWDDTSIVLQGQTILVPGWGNGSASDPAEARIPVFYSSLVRRATSFATNRTRQLHKEANIAMLLDVPFDGTSLYADGIFFDNATGILWNRGTILSGGRVREAPNQVHADSPEFRDWYFDTVTTFLGDLKDSLETSASWSKDGRRKELMVNIANAWDNDYVNKDVADILFLEFQYNPVRNFGVSEIMNAYQRDALAAAAGITSFYSATMTRSVSGHPGEFDYDDTLLGNFAWYLLSRTPSTLLFQQGTNAPSTAGWDTLTWAGAMDVAEQYLGEAIGPPYAFSSGTDPMGHPYQVTARDYEGGLVVLRNRGNWDEGIETGTAINVGLPSMLTPLAPNGSPLPAVDQLSLRNGQGAILVSGEVPVKLLAFTATRVEGGARLQWQTSEESIDHAGFHVYREMEDGSRGRLTTDLLAGQVAYDWIDSAPPSSETRYWLAELTRTGKTTWYGPAVLAAGAEAASVLLAQNRPNPFRGSTTIRFTVAESGTHSMVIYDVQGREVTRLLEGVPSLGTQEVTWDGRDARGVLVAPGIYFYHLRTPGRAETRKLLLTP